MTGPGRADEPRVSVVLPTRDRAQWVGRAIESVLAQTHRPLEILVVDDGSRDDTPQVLKRFGSQIKVLSQRSAGAYAARNLGLRHAAGEFVAFIDSDDVSHPHRLASQLALMQRPAVGLVFGDAVHVRLRAQAESRSLTCFDVTPPRRGLVAGHLARGNFVPTTTVLARRSCLEQVGGFPTSHDRSADYLTWFRIALRHELDYVDAPVADYTVHDGGLSGDLGRSLLARIDLFAAELARTSDPAVREVLRRLVFNLGLHLGLAAARGRAGSITHPWNAAGHALAGASPREGVAWTAAFVARQARIRACRRLDLPRSLGSTA
jgi:glycosyltransferase involved in cell wall biosynthesis